MSYQQAKEGYNYNIISTRRNKKKKMRNHIIGMGSNTREGVIAY
jgi:hypothetical protein